MAARDRSETWLTSSVLEKVIGEQLVDPEDARVIAIHTVPGMQEEETQAAAQRLVDRKAAMTEEEIRQTIEATQEYTAWADAQSEASMINEVNVLTVDELPEEVPETQVSISDRGGIRSITSAVESSDIVSVELVFRVDWVPADQLQRYAHAVQLLGKVRTDRHSGDELSVLKTGYGISFSSTTLSDGADSEVYTPVMKVSVECLKEDLADALALVDEIMTGTQYDECSRIRYQDQDWATTARYLLGQYMPHYMILGLAKAALNAEDLYSYYISDLPYVAYVDRLDAMTDDEMIAEGTELKALLTGVYNTEGLQVTIVSDAEGIAQAEAQVAALTESIPYSVRDTVDYTTALEKLPSRIGVKIPGSATYDIQMVSMADSGYTYSPELDILNSLVYDQILIPVMRYKNGVYSPMNGASASGVYVMAYRDPDFSVTYDRVIPSLAGQIAQLKLDDATLSNLIVNGYTTLAKSSGPLTLAKNAVKGVLNNTNVQQEKLRKMHIYKGITAEKLLADAAIYDALAEKGVKVIAGPSAVIDANADQLDMIVTWYIE